MLSITYGTCNFLFIFFQKIDYLTYLSTFDQLFDISKDKKNAAYKE